MDEVRIGAHVALASGAEVVADAVIDRCFRLLIEGTADGAVTMVFATMAEACAAFGNGPRYAEKMETMAAGVCFAIDDRDALVNLQLIFEVLGQRDPTLIPDLARAQAIADTKIGRA